MHRFNAPGAVEIPASLPEKLIFIHREPNGNVKDAETNAVIQMELCKNPIIGATNGVKV